MKVARLAGSFAGDKDAAASIRDSYLTKTLQRGEVATLDFDGVDLATQSFIHALIAGLIRKNPSNLDRIDFKNCNKNVQSIIEIVAEYAQDNFE